MKAFTVAALIFIYVAAVFATCKKNCTQRNYSFTVNMTATPDVDSIHRNDTIWLQMNVSGNLVDNLSGSTVNYSNAENLSTVIQVGKFIGGNISSPGVVDADNEFQYQIITGTEIQNNYPGVITEVKPAKNNGKYILKIAVVPKNIGIFGLSISNAANVFQQGNTCEKASFEFIFGNTSQHLYFYQQNRPGYQISAYETKHLYCFKVY